MSLIREQERSENLGFIFVGEHPAIDFANTLSTPNGEWRDYLSTWRDVVRWLAQAGLSTAVNLPVSDGTVALKSVLGLRQAWKDVLAELVSGGCVSDKFLAHLNQLLGADVFYDVLERKSGKECQIVRSASKLRGENLVRCILARQIACFLAEANLDHLHRCANTDSCVLYFYDTTKNHRRQWCSGAACGNRHKVAQFRYRQRNAGKFRR